MDVIHKILVTRPLPFSEGLCQGIVALGGMPELFPTIQIVPTVHQKNLIDVIKTVEPGNKVVFVSRSSVRFVLPLMKISCKSIPELTWCAVGPGTAAALEAWNLPPIISPYVPPYESESLLALPDLQKAAIDGQRVIIFRGNGGRELLTDTLRERGAFVQTVETYQRCLPQVDMVERYTRWQNTPLDAIVCTSIEGMNNLLRLVDRVRTVWPTAVLWLKAIPIIVVSTRMEQAAHALGFTKPILAWSAEDAAIIQAIKEIQEKKK